MRRPVLDALSAIAQKLKAQDQNVLSVVLFGSQIKNLHTQLSDADILVILGESSERFIDRIPRFLLVFSDCPVAVDVFPYTEQEARTVPLAQRALREGIRIA